MNYNTAFRKYLKRIHVSGTLWIALCALFLLILAMREAGIRWWIVFSLSGYSGVIFFLLISVYLFAFFRGVIRTQTSSEHPLTTSYAYILFYDICPFLGSVVGIANFLTIPEISLAERFSTISEGALSMTFLVWIILDPVIGSCELLIPKCAAHRRQRLAAIQEEKSKRKKEREHLLKQALEYERINQVRLQQTYEPIADKLVSLLSNQDLKELELHQKIIATGAQAWRLGGLEGMKYLQKTVNNKLKEARISLSWDVLSFYWDGIGSWRKPVSKQMFPA